MHSHSEQSVLDFDALISCWAKAYQCATISYVALKTDHGVNLLFGRILLEPTRMGVNEALFSFESQHLVVARFVLDICPKDIKAFLDNAKNGEIRSVENKTIPLLQTDSGLSAYFSPIYHPGVTEGPRIPTLQVSGASRHNLIVRAIDQRMLDWEVKAAETPFDSLDELLGQCGLPVQMQIGDSTMLEMVAKSPVMIGGASGISDKEAVIECRLAGALGEEELRLGYKIPHQGSVERKSVSGSTLDWRQEGDVKVGVYKFQVENAPLLQAFVSYAGVSFHQWWVVDPSKRLNPRFAVHQVFDESLELLERMLLKPETDKPYAFENAVSTLFSLMGFAISNYGRIPKLQKGPDIIAISPAGHIEVIECTVGLLDESDKLAKLVQRTKLIRDSLREAGYGYLRLQAVIVTPLTREEVTANLETAGKHEIAVICKGDIEEMLRRAKFSPNADRLFDEAKALIPSAGQGNLFGSDK